jgi:hypothetical protein
MTNSEILAQRIEKDVRYLIGDLHMQILVLRNVMALQQGEQPQQEPVPQPAPPAPEHKEPEPKPEQHARTNGAINLRG